MAEELEAEAAEAGVEAGGEADSTPDINFHDPSIVNLHAADVAHKLMFRRNLGLGL